MDAALTLIADYWAAVVAAVVCGVAAVGFRIVYELSHGDVPESSLMALEAGVVSYFGVMPATALGAGALVGPSGGVGRLLLVIGTVLIGLIVHLVLISLNPAKSRVPALIFALGATAAVVAVTWAVASWLPEVVGLVLGIVGFAVFLLVTWSLFGEIILGWFGIRSKDQKAHEEMMAAYAALNGALATMPGWELQGSRYRADDERWHVTVERVRRPGRGRKIEATGATDAAALEAMVTLLEARQVSGG